ncbi:unnamed protein product [Phytophthora lilii]|uniref:Unnamed protein product n=1 Tax=Phytophthora lilii TaxID=2077276 RepID=A0A9W6WGL9_9STRA|nr:unnamed protein product [Phytophthora lilii]
MTDNQQSHEATLMKLVHDLETKPALCFVKDYPAVKLKQLNLYVKEHGPLVNPEFGEQPAFFIDEGRFIPYRLTSYGNQKVAAEIAGELGNWASRSGKRGAVSTSAGAFISGTDVRTPDIAYAPRHTDRNLSSEATWTYRGEPYTPTFVVEIDRLSGQDSRFLALDRKMRTQFFQHGVELGWLIDPHPDSQLMYEYYLNANEEMQSSDNSSWRDLDGRDVLSGFCLPSVALDMVLNQEPASSSEEEVEEMECPWPMCTDRFRLMEFSSCPFRAASRRTSTQALSTPQQLA